MANRTIIVQRPDGAPGAFAKCRKLLAACALCSNPPHMSTLIDQADAELDRLEADALALWAYRVVWLINEGGGLMPRYNNEPDLIVAADALAPELGDRCPRRPV